MSICRRIIDVPADKRPARGIMFEQTGQADTTGCSANGIEVDDSIMTVIGKLRQRKAKDQFFHDGCL